MLLLSFLAHPPTYHPTYLHILKGNPGTAGTAGAPGAVGAPGERGERGDPGQDGNVGLRVSDDPSQIYRIPPLNLITA